VAGRSRTETEIGAGAVSIASAGVHLAGRVFSDFSNRTVVVVGAGDTGRLAAEHFARRNPKRLIILNRTLERAAKLATQLGADAWSISKISDALVNADVLVTAVKVANPVIDAALVESAMRARTSQTLVILDLGLPRNVSTRVNGIVNVFLSDIEDLRQVVDGNLKRRRKETPKVEAFIHQEIDRLMNWQRSFQAGPLIGALREGIEQIRLAELEKLGKNLSQVERAAVDKTTRAIMNKLLHGPMEAIHQYARQAEQGAEGLELIREMFGNLTESLKETASEEDESEGTS
jgi:glutamyl-tRNA reductase